ncbi:MAG: acyltransferase [Candidatus Bathyarchaeota archaeon]|nr:MAG: acyltransferase [Candidatus Bathyarchaeota archaeon]
MDTEEQNVFDRNLMHVKRYIKHDLQDCVVANIMTAKEDDESTPAKFRYIPKLLERDMSSNFWDYVERVTGQRSLRKFVAQGLTLTLLSDFPSILGIVLRGKLYRKILGHMGKNCLIERHVRFMVPENIFLGDRVFIDESARLDATFSTSEIRLGNDVSIGQHSILKASIGRIIIHEGVGIARFVFVDGNGGIEIGENSMLGNKVELISGEHVFDDPSILIKLQGRRYEKIEIGRDVWIGAMVVVLPGVKIGDGSVIGAGAVVTQDIPRNSVAAGIPARVVKKRGES